MATTPKMVRVLGNGAVPSPSDVRQRLGIEADDVVSVVEPADGLPIASRDLSLPRALDPMAEAPRGQNVPLENLVESAREERAKLVREQSGLDPATGPV